MRRQRNIESEIDTIQENAANVTPAVTRAQVLEARRAVSEVHIAPAVLETIVSIVQGTRTSPLLQFGASTRAAIMFKKALGAWALNEGRDYVGEDDVKFLAPFVLLHRLKFHPGAGDVTEAFEELIRPHIEKLVSSSLKAAS